MYIMRTTKILMEEFNKTEVNGEPDHVGRLEHCYDVSDLQTRL